MLVGGRKPQPNLKTLVLPREGGEPVVFKARAVPSLKDLETLTPSPTPPMMRGKGGSKIPDMNNVVFIAAIAEMASKRTDYIVLKSLEATPDLVWETVNMAVPDTWKNWRTEMIESGFGYGEVQLVISLAIQANNLDDSLLEEAKNSFLAGEAQEQE